MPFKGALQGCPSRVPFKGALQGVVSLRVPFKGALQGVVSLRVPFKGVLLGYLSREPFKCRFRGPFKGAFNGISFKEPFKSTLQGGFLRIKIPFREPFRGRPLLHACSQGCYSGVPLKGSRFNAFCTYPYSFWLISSIAGSTTLMS